jgi:hypothetical protein
MLLLLLIVVKALMLLLLLFQLLLQRNRLLNSADEQIEQAKRTRVKQPAHLDEARMLRCQRCSVASYTPNCPSLAAPHLLLRPCRDHPGR